MKRRAFSLTSLLFLLAFVLLLFGFGIFTYRSASGGNTFKADLPSKKGIELELKLERKENR